MRTLRTGEAAIAIEANGYGAEAAPLVRSALEHAIRLRWAAKHGDEFIEVALIAQKKGNTNLRGAQTEDWEFSPELANSLEEHSAEASDEYKSKSHLTALRTIVEADQDRLGSLYMAWLFDTQDSHPSLITARHYFEAAKSGEGYSLLTQSKFDSAIAIKCCYSLIAAIDGYAEISGLGSYYDAPLRSIVQRFAEASQRQSYPK